MTDPNNSYETAVFDYLATRKSGPRIDRALLKRKARIIEDLEFDSLDSIELIQVAKEMAEDRGHTLNIPDEEAEAFKTLGDVIDYPDTHTNSQKQK